MSAVPRNNLQENLARTFPASGEGFQNGFVYALPHQKPQTASSRCLITLDRLRSSKPPPLSHAHLVSTFLITTEPALFPVACYQVCSLKKLLTNTNLCTRSVDRRQTYPQGPLQVTPAIQQVSPHSLRSIQATLQGLMHIPSGQHRAFIILDRHWY